MARKIDSDFCHLCPKPSDNVHRVLQHNIYGARGLRGAQRWASRSWEGLPGLPLVEGLNQQDSGPQVDVCNGCKPHWGPCFLLQLCRNPGPQQAAHLLLALFREVATLYQFRDTNLHPKPEVSVRIRGSAPCLRYLEGLF